MGLKKYDTIKKSEEGQWMDVEYPDGTEDGAKIKLVGCDSKLYRNKIKKLAEKNRNKKKGLSVVETEKASMNMYVACTLDWEGIAYDDDTPIEFNRENVEKVYTEYPWLLNDVAEFIAERENFL